MTPSLLAFYLGVAGLVVGSFLGLVSLRLPQDEDVVRDPSHCRACGRPLSWPDLIPVASYVWTRGRCRTCGVTIPWRYPALELASAGVGVWAALVGSTPVEAVLTALLGWQLLLIAVIDLEHLWLPDRLTLPLLATGLISAGVLPAQSILGTVVGADVGFTSLWAVGFVYRRVRGRDGLGGGDPVLFAAIGAWVGVMKLPQVLLLACCIGLGLVAAAALSRTTRLSDRLPFGL